MNNGVPNKTMCCFKQHLILLANYLYLTCERINKYMMDDLAKFVERKYNRSRKNQTLIAFANRHPSLSFTEAKKMFNKEFPDY